jgi:putative SOS response-associated peptidase YedK
MCGRFTYRLTWPELVRLYRLTLDAPARNTQPRYNICPTTSIGAVIERDGTRELLPMRWGLIPSWWSSRSVRANKPPSNKAEHAPRGFQNPWSVGTMIVGVINFSQTYP